MRCPSCEAEIEDGSRFCPHCGSHLGLGPDRSVPREDTVRHAGPDEPARREEPVPELTSCPRCSAPNSPHRVLCGRCGADLQSGETGVAPRPTAHPSPEPGTDEQPPGPSRSRRAWIVVVVLGALIGSAIGLVVWLRAGADGLGADPEATFDPARHADDPQELQVVEATASSHLDPEGPISYEPSQAVDGDPTTAWNEGADGHGEGEHLRLELGGEAWVRRIVLRNGYQKDDRAFFDNARADRVLVRFDDAAYVVHLHDQLGEQAITLPEPVRTSAVTVEIVEAIPGQQYADLAVSELRLFGWPVQDGSG